MPTTNQPKQCRRCNELHDPQITCADGGSPKAKDHLGLATPAEMSPLEQIMAHDVDHKPATPAEAECTCKHDGSVHVADGCSYPYCGCKADKYDSYATPQPEPTAEHDPVVNVIGLEFRIKQLNHYLEINFVNQAYYDDMLTRAIKGAVATERRAAIEFFAEKLKRNFIPNCEVASDDVRDLIDELLKEAK